MQYEAPKQQQATMQKIQVIVLQEIALLYMKKTNNKKKKKEKYVMSKKETISLNKKDETRNKKKKNKTIGEILDKKRLEVIKDFMSQLVNSSAAVENISTLKDLSTIEKSKLNKEFYDEATANGKATTGIALRRSYIAGCYYDMILAMYDETQFRSKRRKHNINDKRKEEEKRHVEAYTPEEIENKEYVEKHNRKCLIRYVKFKKVIDELKSENLKHRVLNCIIGVNKWEKLIVQVPTEDGGNKSLFACICEYVNINNNPTCDNFISSMKEDDKSTDATVAVVENPIDVDVNKKPVVHMNDVKQDAAPNAKDGDVEISANNTIDLTDGKRKIEEDDIQFDGSSKRAKVITNEYLDELCAGIDFGYDLLADDNLL
jgi:hypothetical protein